MTVTIKQIAQESGYSTATVSRLFSADPTLSITEQTRRAIIETAERLGYTPKVKKTIPLPRTIALLDTSETTPELQDIYFDDLRATLERIAAQYRMDVHRFTSTNELIKNHKHFDGFITIGQAYLQRPELEQLHTTFEHGVFVDTNPAPAYFDSVQPDLQQAVLEAIDIALSSGKKRIAFLGGTGRIMGLHAHEEDPRAFAFRNWTSRLGLEETTVCYESGAFTQANGRKLAHTLLSNSRRKLPDVVIVAADTLAIGVLQEFNAAGVLVPRDISVISIDDLPIALYTSPALTSFAIDLEELADTAIATLADALSTKRSTKRHTLISMPLTVRDSFVPLSSFEQ